MFNLLSTYITQRCKKYSIATFLSCLQVDSKNNNNSCRNNNVLSLTNFLFYKLTILYLKILLNSSLLCVKLSSFSYVSKTDSPSFLFFSVSGTIEHGISSGIKTHGQ